MKREPESVLRSASARRKRLLAVSVLLVVVISFGVGAFAGGHLPGTVEDSEEDFRTITVQCKPAVSVCFGVLSITTPDGNSLQMPLRATAGDPTRLTFEGLEGGAAAIDAIDPTIECPDDRASVTLRLSGGASVTADVDTFGTFTAPTTRGGGGPGDSGDSDSTLTFECPGEIPEPP